MCAAVSGRCSRGPGCVRRGFPSSRFFSSRWMGLGWGEVPVVLFSVTALRLVLVGFLREMVAGFFSQ